VVNVAGAAAQAAQVHPRITAIAGTNRFIAYPVEPAPNDLTFKVYICEADEAIFPNQLRSFTSRERPCEERAGFSVIRAWMHQPLR
jgi:hypothetical protein